MHDINKRSVYIFPQSKFSLEEFGEPSRSVLKEISHSVQFVKSLKLYQPAPVFGATLQHHMLKQKKKTWNSENSAAI